MTKDFASQSGEACQRQPLAGSFRAEMSTKPCFIAKNILLVRPCVHLYLASLTRAYVLTLSTKQCQSRTRKTVLKIKFSPSHDSDWVFKPKLLSIPQKPLLYISTISFESKMEASMPDSPTFANKETVAVYVGGKKTAFHIHENLLSDCSPVFKVAFEQRLTMEFNDIMALPNVKTVDFEHFTKWLYTGPCGLDASKSLPGKLESLISLYVFADKYEILQLKSCICDQIIQILDQDKGFQIPPLDCVAFTYANLPLSSALRKLLIDWFVWGVESSWFDSPENRDSLGKIPEFAVDSVAALTALRCNPLIQNPFLGDTSRYYDPARDLGEIRLQDFFSWG